MSYYRRWMNKFSKMKVHWWTYNHCLFVAYLASVAIGNGWMSDTKFQKFLDKDWIWIFKKFIGYGSGVKKSISAHLWSAAEMSIGLDLDWTGSGLLRILLILDWIRAAKCSKNLGSGPNSHWVNGKELHQFCH